MAAEQGEWIANDGPHLKKSSIAAGCDREVMLWRVDWGKGHPVHKLVSHNLGNGRPAVTKCSG